jgi:methionine-gamma-lyase
LFSAPGSSTSSEISEEEQKEMGLSDGLIRFSIGLDNNIQRTYEMMKSCMIEVGVLNSSVSAVDRNMSDHKF